MTRPDSVPAVRLLAGAALCILLTAGASRPLSAQDQALVLSVHGGQHFPVSNMPDAGDEHAPRFGAGINRVSRVGAWFLEVDGLLYKYEGFGLGRTQFDIETNLGFALALGL